jgi:hypothetical protein
MPSLPEVSTVAEQGFPGFERAEATSLWAPAGTPAAVIGRLQEAVVAALAEQEVLARLELLGMTPGRPARPAQLAAGDGGLPGLRRRDDPGGGDQAGVAAFFGRAPRIWAME